MATRLDSKPQQSIPTSSIVSKLRQLKSEIKDHHSIQLPSSSTPPPSQLPRIRDLPAWNQFRSEIEQQIEIQAKTLEQEQEEKENDSQQSTSSSVSTQNHIQIQPQNEDEGEIGYKQKIQDRLDRSKKLGPDYIVAEDTVRNDYSQRFVDSGIGELPGNGVRNPSFETRFQEYPRLQKLVRMKDIQIIKQSRNPTYLQADLKQSLMPFSEFTSKFLEPSKESIQEQNTDSSNDQDPSSNELSREQQGEEDNYEGMTASSSTITSSPGRNPSHQSLLPTPSHDSTETSISTSTSVASTSDQNRESDSSPGAIQTSDQHSGVSETASKRPFHLLQLLPIKFDVIVIDPPLEAYEWEETPCSSKESGRTWSWRDISELPIPNLAAKESFIFLWVGTGSGDGLERGREILTKWGYRRCEDIVWVRTNPNANEIEKEQASTNSALSRSAHHCLMGIKGTVKRSIDTNFVHCNVDTDVILWDGESGDSFSTDRSKPNSSTNHRIDARSKPPELYNIAENFCLGTRRLELFGRNRNLRRGWLTVGLEVGSEAEDWRKGQAPLQDIRAVEQAKNPLLNQVEDQEQSTSISDSVLDSNFQALKPIQYSKERFDSNFTPENYQVELRFRGNLMPFNDEIDSLRPRSPSHFHNAGRGGFGRGNFNRDPTSSRDSPLPKGLGKSSVSPSMKPQEILEDFAFISSFNQDSSSRDDVGLDRYHQQKEMQAQIQSHMNLFYQNQQVQQQYLDQNQSLHYPSQGHLNPMFVPQNQQGFHPVQQPHSPRTIGGSGLGAGIGSRVVSVHSGDEILSGPQRVVLAQQQSRGGRVRGSRGSGR